MAEGRNEKGQFLPGQIPEGSTPFSAGVAQDMQLRSAAQRKQNTIIRDAMLKELAKEMAPGMTKADYLVAKAAANHAKGKMTFKDLKDLQHILGESVTTINLEHGGVIEVVKSEEERQRLLDMVNRDI